MGGLPFWEYVSQYRSDLIADTQAHLLVSIYVIITAAALGLLIAVLSYRSSIGSSLVVGSSSVFFTLPSIALFGLMVPILGLGLKTAFPVLVLYALLPIIRNAIVGLQSVDDQMVDAAKGIGMSRFRILWQVELPIAWPVIMTGVRVAAQLTVGLVVIGSFVLAPGLGKPIINSLSGLGSANTLNQAISATILVLLLALVIDLVFVFIRRITTPRGLRV